VSPERSPAEYVATGNGTGLLVFVRGGDLIAQPVDAKTLRFRASPTRLTTRMGMGISRLPAFSASPSLLAYRSDVGASELVWTDRDGNPTGARYGGKGRIASFDLSPDEKAVAYGQRNWEINQDEIRIVDVESGSEEVLFAPGYLTGNPIFSPNGRRLAFADSNDYRGMRIGILTLGAKGRPVFHPEAELGFNVRAWFDGTILGSSARIITAVPDEFNAKPTIVTEGMHPRISPRRDWLTYTFRDSSGPKVYVQRHPQGTSRTVVSQGQGFQPQWSGDHEIVYLTDDGTVRAVSLTLGERVTINRDSNLFSGRFRAGGAEYTRRDLAVTKDGQRFLVNLATSDPAKVTLIRNWQTLLTSK
jgi:hypothetical protein